jgi:hypothetical protein
MNRASGERAGVGPSRTTRAASHLTPADTPIAIVDAMVADIDLTTP